MCIIMHENMEKVIAYGHDPGEEVQQQHLCPRELITLDRCKKAGLNYKKAAYLRK